MRIKSIQAVIIMIFSLAYGASETESAYVLIFACTLLSLIFIPKIRQKNASVNKMRSKLSSLIIYLPLFVVLSWFYGACVGLFRNVPYEYAFRNFFGLLAYLWFYSLMIIRPSINSLMIALLIGGIVQIFYGMTASVDLISNPSIIFAGDSISDARSIYSGGSMVLFPLIALGLSPKNNEIFQSREPIIKSKINVTDLCKNPLFFITCCYTVIIPSLSKGFILGFILLLACHLFQSTVIALKRGMSPKLFIYASLFLVVVFPFLPIELQGLLMNSFSNDEVSNIVRAEQFNKIVEDFSFFGSGLGSSLSSGYKRDATGYGFELTFLNLIHKLGFFVLPLFLSYATTIIASIDRIIHGFQVKESYFIIGCMVYLIPGSGNPILLSPQAVILHCIAMYIFVSPYLVEIEI